MHDPNLQAVVALKLRQSAEAVAAAARAICPRKTGELADSIRVLDADSEHADVGTDCEYALDVELGTHKQSPHPFLRPALDIARPVIAGIWGGI